MYGFYEIFALFIETLFLSNDNIFLILKKKKRKELSTFQEAIFLQGQIISN